MELDQDRVQWRWWTFGLCNWQHRSAVSDCTNFTTLWVTPCENRIPQVPTLRESLGWHLLCGSTKGRDECT